MLSNNTCSNCYTGCTSVMTDKCVKYTGVDYPLFGIKTGDSLSYVEQALLGFVAANSDGTGIKFVIPEEDLCVAVSTHLPDCEDWNIVNISIAFSKAICAIDATLTTLGNTVSTLESNYLPGCLTGVDGSEGTHIVLQATIAQACANASAIEAININLTTNYVSIADINTYIQNYLDSLGDDGGGPGVQASKMVPYTVVEYYGTLTHFDSTGAGTGDWTNIYLCNGNNNTPDKRGRVAVGTTSGMGGGAFSSEVNPALPGNPTYTLLSTGGTNTVTLSALQLPAHTHTGVTATDPGHTHTYTQYKLDQQVSDNGNGIRGLDKDNVQTGAFVTSTGGSHSHTFTTASAGGGQSHPNIQPVIACHYIMYIPAT